MAEGYAFLKSTRGRQAADEVRIPFWRLRQACGSNPSCIRQRQAEAIIAFHAAGAPVFPPDWSRLNGSSSQRVANAPTQESRPVAPSAPATPVKSMDVIDFLVDWKSLMGQTVTVTGCSLRHADQTYVACSAEPQGHFFIESDTLAREDLRRSLRSCAGFEEAEDCRADVTGTVTENDVLGPELKNAAIEWTATSAAPQPPRLASPSPQAQGTSPPVPNNETSVAEADERIRSEIVAYAATKGETSEEFSRRVGSSLEEIIAFAFAVEKSGGTSLGAIKSLEGFSEAMKNPDKRKLVQCLGVPLTKNPDEPMPSESECAALQQRFGRAQ